MPREPIRRTIDGRVLTLVQGDITHQRVDAIVNAANSRLVGGGGVDGAIRRAGGPAIEEECARIRAAQGGCPTGSAVITGAGRLPARYVIHAVGPVWYGGRQGEAELLASAYRASLELAAAHGVRTIAFPSISTGVYGYPVSLAARVALGTVAEVVQGTSIEEVRFVLFSEPDFDAYAAALEEVLGPMKQEPSLHDRSDRPSTSARGEELLQEVAGTAPAQPEGTAGGAGQDGAPGGSPGMGGQGAQPQQPLWQTTPPGGPEEAGAPAPTAAPRRRAQARPARKPARAARRRGATTRRRGAAAGRRGAARRAAGGARAGRRRGRTVGRVGRRRGRTVGRPARAARGGGRVGRGRRGARTRVVARRGGARRGTRRRRA
jgi:O-acetyl-ADP-ribose deacetylase (regulator of RNase III)